MQIDTYTEPWKYHVVKDFLPAHLHDQVKKYFSETTKWPKFTPSVNRHANELKALPDVYNYFVNSESILKELCKNELEERQSGLSKKKFKVYQSKLCIDYPGYFIDTHTDIYQKVITLVYYVTEEGTGTAIIDKQNDTENELERIPNSMLVFVAKHHTTHHAVRKCDKTRKSIQFMFTI
jgi:hypothetical protein